MVNRHILIVWDFRSTYTIIMVMLVIPTLVVMVVFA